MKPRILLAALLIGGTIARIPGLFTDFWLDEIWGLRLAQGAASVKQILFGTHLDVNHPMNTLLLYWLQPQRSAAFYRLPAFVAGVLTMGLIAYSRPRRTPLWPLLVTLLSASSSLLVLYSSEARGYALMLFFALVCFNLVVYRERVHVPGLCLFGLSAVLGFLSNATFVIFYAALVLWHAFDLTQQMDWNARIKEGMAFHAVPVALMGWYGSLYYLGMATGGGAKNGLLRTLYGALTYTMGHPPRGPAAWILGTTLAMVLGNELLGQGRKRSSFARFCVILFMIGGLTLAAMPWRYERYLLICLPFALMLIADFLERSLASRHLWLAFAVLGLYLSGNGLRLAAFYETGRGTYSEALTYLAARTSSDTATVGGDHDFRNRMVMEYTADHLRLPKAIMYVDHAEVARHAPEWFFFHIFNPAVPVLPLVRLPGTAAMYQFEKTFPYAQLPSGWEWRLYHRTSTIKESL